jgi:ABC-type polar amino acid transport system ATPase subunit
LKWAGDADDRHVLKVSGLTVIRDGRTILNGVTLSVSRGELVVLMGESGSGKTTVLRAVAGLEPFAAGSIDLDGRVGMVFQFHNLFANLTALHNVWLAPVHVHRIPKADAEKRATQLLESLGVGHRAAAFPHELSGGEAQRVAIARALAMDPPLLLMDEPTASLDPARRAELAETLRSLVLQGRTLIIATHDAEFVRQCAGRVVTLTGGCIDG